MSSSSVSSAALSSAAVTGASAVGSNPFAVSGVYPAMTAMQASPPQYMLVQTGSGACYVPVTYGPFVMSPPPQQPIFSPPPAAPAAAVAFQLPNPQQPAPVALHGQMHPANPFLVINSKWFTTLPTDKQFGFVLSLCSP